MNQRIRELALQANANELSYAYYRGEKKPENAVTLHSVDLEKFAELIVEECVKVAHPKLTDVGEWAAGMRLVQKRLKQHFGVEE
jgi:hypothetical protein